MQTQRRAGDRRGGMPLPRCGDQSATTEASQHCVRSEQRHRGRPTNTRRTTCSRIPSSTPRPHATASTRRSRSPRPVPAPSGGGRPRRLSAPADRGGVGAGNCSVGWQPASPARRHSHRAIYPRRNAHHLLARTGETGYPTPIAVMIAGLIAAHAGLTAFAPATRGCAEPRHSIVSPEIQPRNTRATPVAANESVA